MLMLAEPRRVNLRVRDGMWLRIVDVVRRPSSGAAMRPMARSCSTSTTSSCPRRAAASG